MESEKQLTLLKERIPYDKDIFTDGTTYAKVLKNLLRDSKYIALSIRYPFKDYSNIELPIKYYNWQIRCSVELYQMLGKENIKSYSENGIAFTKDGSNLSPDLYSEIMPTVGVVTDD